jgi:hypothetical protein
MNFMMIESRIFNQHNPRGAPPPAGAAAASTLERLRAITARAGLHPA